MPREPSGVFRACSSVARPAGMRTSRSSPFPAMNPAQLHREWKSFRQLARVPFSSVIQWLDRPRLIKMEHGIELICQPRLEIVAHTLGFGAIDYPDRPLQQGVTEGIPKCLIHSPGEQETTRLSRKEQCLIA